MSGEAPVKIVAASQSSSDGRAFLVSKDSTVKNLNDLIGKKVAVQRGNVAEYTFLKTLEKRNIAKDKIERVYIAPQDAAVALAQSKVDAWVTWDPYISIAETQNGAKVTDFGVWTSLDDFVKSKPELASAVISALAKEGAWANANAKDALGIIAKELNLPAEVADRMATRPSNCTIIGIDDKVAGEIQLTADWLKENSVIPNAVDLNKSVVRNLVK
ncbi:MAG: ABC transporter substrate-binding protein [Chloroflexi bacterium]|nr:ABC transporter substrate-binding protein [Chloroflexota bacterium]